MAFKLDLKNFEIKTFDFKEKKGMIVKFFDIENPDKVWTVDNDGKPHEDFVNAFSQLKEVLAYSLGLNNGWDFAKEHNRKNDELLKKALQFWKDEIERCLVKGITVVGVGDSKGIKIAGSMKTDLGVVGLPSPIIRFDAFVTNSIDEDVMIGDLAEVAFNKIQEEVWAFIFKGKRGGELFPAEEQESGLNGVPKMMKVG